MSATAALLHQDWLLTIGVKVSKEVGVEALHDNTHRDDQTPEDGFLVASNCIHHRHGLLLLIIVFRDSRKSGLRPHFVAADLVEYAALLDDCLDVDGLGFLHHDGKNRKHATVGSLVKEVIEERITERMSRADELDLLETSVQRGRVLAFYIFLALD